MKSIYTHLSPDKFSFSKELNHSNYTYSDIPSYAKYSFQQTEKFLKDKPIILTNQHIAEQFEQEINEFYKLCKTGFPSFYKDPFWLTTLLRLYVVYLYAIKNNIDEFIHLEYDNLIYTDLKILQVLPKSIYFTRVGPYCSSAGFVYCNSLNHLKKTVDKFKQLLKKGERVVRTYTQYDHLSEMILLDLIHTHTKDVMDYLPILPTGIGSDNFDKLQVLFDGASYGQFLGGTNNGADKGWYGRHHYIGNAIFEKNIEIFFDKSPFIIYNREQIPICNLHIHSKNLKKFYL